MEEQERTAMKRAIERSFIEPYVNMWELFQQELAKLRREKTSWTIRGRNKQHVKKLP